MLKSLQQTVATARKCPGRNSPSSVAPQLGDLDPGLVARRVHLLDRWREQEVDACVGEEAGVSCLVTRVTGEVCGLAELSRVHEQAGDDEIALTRGAQQREMALVERAHGRNEPDPRRAAGRLEGRAHLRDRA